MAEIPVTRFAKLGRDKIAYQVIGDGPVDLLWAPSLGDALDARWEYPPFASFLRRLASFSRLIMFDRRGIGGSDPVSGQALPSWEGWSADALAVLDAVDSERAALLAAHESGPTAVLFAATRPDRARSLVLVNSVARFLRDDDYPWGMRLEDLDGVVSFIEESWGTERAGTFTVGGATDEAVYLRWAAKSNRVSCSPRVAGAFMREAMHMDVRSALPSVAVPTLVLHRKVPAMLTIEQGRHLADNIPDARFVAVPGESFLVYHKPASPILAHIEEFLTGAPISDTDRTLAAVLFTDIVGSTERAAELGDRRWRDLLDAHDGMTNAIIGENHGRLVKLTGDGMLATFDGPGRAIRCALALRDALEPLGLTIRAGLHVGEVEVRDGDISGIAVHVAARVLGHAGPGELLTSAAVPLLVTGSDIEFEVRGDRELKGIRGVWQLFAVVD